MPQKLTTTACFIQEESSGGKQFRKHVSCFYAQGAEEVGQLSRDIFRPMILRYFLSASKRPVD